LKELALKHNFLLIEDRKLFDIGSTVKSQVDFIQMYKYLTILLKLNLFEVDKGDGKNINLGRFCNFGNNAWSGHS